MITPDALAPFIDPAAIAIVAGGTVAATLLRTPLSDVGRGIAALRVLPRRNLRAEPLIDQVRALGRIARRHGVRTLARSVLAAPAVAAAIAEIVDGATPADVPRMHEARRRARELSHAGVVD